VSGFVGDNTWNYYHYNAFSSYNLMVTMNQTSALGDCDLYVKSDSNPTRFDYTYRYSPLPQSVSFILSSIEMLIVLGLVCAVFDRDISFRSNVTLAITNPADLTWYVGVFGYRSCAYVLSVLDTCTLRTPFLSACSRSLAFRVR
jgi:hypothetical protein